MCCFASRSWEKLLPLGNAESSSKGKGLGAFFVGSSLPSRGDLTEESDRKVVRFIEQDIRETYSQLAIQNEAARARAALTSGGASKICLDGKQLISSDMSQLTSALKMMFLTHTGEGMQHLSLSGNEIEGGGVRVLVELCLTQQSGRNVKILDLSDNVLGPEGSASLQDWLALPLCYASSLHLDSNDIGDEGAAQIARWLPSAATLQMVTLCDNGITAVGAKVLLAAALAHEAVCLDLAGNDLSKRQWVQLERSNNRVMAHSAMDQAWDGNDESATTTTPTRTGSKTGSRKGSRSGMFEGKREREGGRGRGAGEADTE